ncbi:MAG: hypothetical protein IJC17_07855 [Clostridia bacterium]|nr:hypothetical protein [Clostridia bacterium]
MDVEAVRLFLFGLLCGVLFVLLIHFTIQVPKRRLAAKFASLGDLTGKSYAQIKCVVGEETVCLTEKLPTGDTATIRKWSTVGYHIVLLFDCNDRFIAVSSETYK